MLGDAALARKTSRHSEMKVVARKAEGVKGEEMSGKSPGAGQQVCSQELGGSVLSCYNSA